jgi:malate dehydrogenase
MVPVSSHSKSGKIPVKDLIPPKELAAIEQRTRDGGAEIVTLLKTGSAFYAPASAVCEMVRAILRDERKTLPLCAYLQGEFGLEGIYFGVPAELDKTGVRRVVEISLTDEETRNLKASAEKVKAGVAELEKLISS